MACLQSVRFLKSVIKKLLFAAVLFIFASKRIETALNDHICKLFYLLPN